MADNIYRMQHRWVVRGPIQTVFRYVSDARTFCDWFTVFEAVHPDEPAGPIRVGSHSTMRVKARLPYVLDWDVTVTRREPPYLQETAVQVSLGGRFEMRGRITFRFEERPDGTVAVYNNQELTANRPVPGFVKPLADWMFRYNHRWAMRQAEAPLQAIVAGATRAITDAACPHGVVARQEWHYDVASCHPTT
jgi:hypothetical protein